MLTPLEVATLTPLPAVTGAVNEGVPSGVTTDQFVRTSGISVSPIPSTIFHPNVASIYANCNTAHGAVISK